MRPVNGPATTGLVWRTSAERVAVPPSRGGSGSKAMSAPLTARFDRDDGRTRTDTGAVLLDSDSSGRRSKGSTRTARLTGSPVSDDVQLRVTGAEVPGARLTPARTSSARPVSVACPRI